MLVYASLFAALVLEAVALPGPQFGGPPKIDRDPADGPIPTKGIEACTNMMTQPNPNPKNVRNDAHSTRLSIN